MRFSLFSTTLLVFSAGSFACRSGMINQSPDQGSQLSEINLKVPTKAEYPTSFGGANCPDVKLKEEELTRLGVKDPCDALEKLMDSYRLTISVLRCDDGVTGTRGRYTNRVGQGKIQEKVVKGCDYNLLLEVGELARDRVYYSNSHQSQGLLKVPKDAAARIPLTVELMVTTVGVDIGLPSTSTIISNPEVSVDISIVIGSKGTPDDSSKPPQDSDNTTTRLQRLNTIAEGKCAPCHANGGAAQHAARSKFVGDPSELKKRLAAIKTRTGANAPSGLQMPPAAFQKALTDEERAFIQSLDTSPNGI